MVQKMKAMWGIMLQAEGTEMIIPGDKFFITLNLHRHVQHAPHTEGGVGSHGKYKKYVRFSKNESTL